MMELLDIYTPDGVKTGRVVPRGTKPGPNEYYLVVHLCIFNSAGQLLIQLRNANKRGWPGKWDFSAGGHAQSGEDGRTAALREAREELSLDATAASFAFRCTVPQVLDDFFVLKANLDCSDLTIQKEELSAVRWVNRQELLALLLDDSFVPYSEELINGLFDTYT